VVGDRNFIDELKRRRVPRVVLVYIASAFAVIQGADLIVPRLGLPDWLVTALLVVALIGLPVAVVLAWMFDITPGGVQRAEDVSPSQRWLSPRTILIVVGAFAMTAGMAWYAGRAGAHKNIEDATRSIAVLPFVNAGGAAEDQHFSDGMADELLNLLGRIDGLKVAARTSSFAFRDRANDIRMIGDSLGVLSVLEGTVRRDGNRVRVTVNLINVADGMRVWSDQYDDDIDNIFVVQERIASAIARELRLRLGDAVASRKSVDPQAFDLYLQGLAQLRLRTRGEHVHNAIGLFERAISIDSAYAQPYGGLAMAYAVLPHWDTVSTTSSAPRVHEYANRAIELDDRLPEPYAALCQSLGLAEWKWDEAEQACRLALERNASHESAHAWLGELLAVRGRPDEAVRELDRALMLDPYSPVIHNMAGFGAFAARDLMRAEYMMSRVFALDSTMVEAVWGGAAIDIAQGELAQARARLQPLAPAFFLNPFFKAMTDPAARPAVAQFLEATINRKQSNWASRAAASFALTQNREKALEYLQLAFDRREFDLATAVVSPMLDAVNQDPRFHNIMRGMGLDPDVLMNARAMRLNGRGN